MTQRNYTLHDVDLLVAKGRLARSRAVSDAIAAAVRAIAGLVKPLFAAVAARAEQARALRELRDMDARMLADIGLTPADVELAASGKLRREDDGPRLQPANESLAQPARAEPKAA
jgi:uncharacterized protein YjiS (DUF1127 family)